MATIYFLSHSPSNAGLIDDFNIGAIGCYLNSNKLANLPSDVIIFAFSFDLTFLVTHHYLLDIVDIGTSHAFVKTSMQENQLSHTKACHLGLSLQ